MKEAGSALMGIGSGVGENRAQMAARAAVSSPLLEVSIEGAKGILFNIIGGPDMTMIEVDEAARIISEAADADANIIFGAAINEKLVDQMKITVIATGFDEARSRLANMMSRNRPVYTGSPITTGIVSEKPKTGRPITAAKISEESQIPSEQPESTDQTPPVSPQPPYPDGPQEEEDWDIPAFLRQGR